MADFRADIRQGARDAGGQLKSAAALAAIHNSKPMPRRTARQPRPLSAHRGWL